MFTRQRITIDLRLDIDHPADTIAALLTAAAWLLQRIASSTRLLQQLL
jgi:TorA maturation chaperone TorD